MAKEKKGNKEAKKPKSTANSAKKQKKVLRGMMVSCRLIEQLTPDV